MAKVILARSIQSKKKDHRVTLITLSSPVIHWRKRNGDWRKTRHVYLSSILLDGTFSMRRDSVEIAAFPGKLFGGRHKDGRSFVLALEEVNAPSINDPLVLSAEREMVKLLSRGVHRVNSSWSW